MLVIGCEDSVAVWQYGAKSQKWQAVAQLDVSLIFVRSVVYTRRGGFSRAVVKRRSEIRSRTEGAPARWFFKSYTILFMLCRVIPS